MNPKKWFNGILFCALAALVVGCGGGSSTTPVSQQQTGTMFVTSADAPLPSVVSFQVDITGMTVSDGVNPPVSILNGTQTVDFARLNGLRTLLDINTIPTGTYTQVNITLANPQIGYLNVSNPPTNPPTRPTVSTLNSTTSPAVTLTTSSVNITLAQPLMVNANDIIGLKFEFDLRKSIAVDGAGQITGSVTPNLDLKAITPSDADAYIDDFVSGVVSVNAGGNSFVVQGPHGHQFTVNVNGETEFEGGETLADLTVNSIVEISGTLDRLSHAILADSVGIVSQDKFWAGGLITFVEPPNGTATDFDLYVRNVLPANTGFNSGQISTIDLTGNEKYFIYWMHNVFVNPHFSNIFFNSGLLVPGQHVSIAGPFNNGTVTVKRVVLRHEGHTGTWVVGSTNPGASTFQFNSNGLAGVLFNGPVTVYVTPFTRFLGGLHNINDLQGTTALPLRVVGLILKDPISGQPVFVARSVELLN
ncbi:MAG TPA: DUF4382 domain-containing protein [Candidatus Dormibacteraeota bacterium]|jgi:hypothetical protein|nr:DUF4382 domain-containing protein [Candidatus Dormibacteraeota bacterium]